MKLIIFTILVAGVCDSFAQSAGLYIPQTNRIGALTGLMQVNLAVRTLSANILAGSTALTAFATGITVAPHSTFAVAPQYINQFTLINTGLDDLSRTTTGSLVIVDNAILRINLTPGINDPSTLQTDLNAIAAGVNNINVGISAIIVTAGLLAVGVELLLLNTGNFGGDLITCFNNIEAISAVILTEADAITQFAVNEGARYAGWFQLVMQLNGLPSAIRIGAVAGTAFKNAIISQIPYTLTAAPVLTAMTVKINTVVTRLNKLANDLANV